MTISNGVNTKHLTLYSPAQPLLQDDQIIWPDLDDTKHEVISIHQLMMISKEPFIAFRREDEIISSIILNEYGVETQVCSQGNCVLNTLLPPIDALQYLETSKFLHTLLPHEMKSFPIAQLSMAEKVTKIEVNS